MLLPGVGLGFLYEFEQGLASGVSLASKTGRGKQGVKVFGVSGFRVHGLHAGVMLLDHMSCP